MRLDGNTRQKQGAGLVGQLGNDLFEWASENLGRVQRQMAGGEDCAR